jgi:hypothetical protein
MENDIRKLYPESVVVKSGDKIIVPLNTEEGNPNKIEFDVEIK